MKDLDLKDKIMGALYGCAIGDALGVAGEFMTKEEVAIRYPQGVKDYADIYRDAHRSQWEPGEWTNDTEMNMRMLQALVDDDAYDIHTIARKFTEWYQEDYPDVVPQYRFLFKHPDYVKRPAEVAYQVWSDMGACDASNEALPRAVITGMSGDRYIERGAEICAITHPDPRCIGCGMAISRMAHDLMWHRRITDEETLVNLVRPVDDRIIPYIRWAQQDTLEPFDLDDEDTMWYVRKAMGVAIWCLWHNLTMEEAFDAILAEGGDVDTNCAVALSLIGIRDGVECFPRHLRDGLKYKSRLDEMGDKLMVYFNHNEHHA